MSKRILALFTAVFTAIFVFASPAHAAPSGSPHFIKSATSATLSGSSLVVTFKEAGLPNGQQETITVSSLLTATYQCVNKNGTNPNDPKKTESTSETSAQGQFTVQNGNVTGTLTLTAPAANTQIDCPRGQRAVLSVFSYGDVTIFDSTSQVGITIPGPFSGGSLIE